MLQRDPGVSRQRFCRGKALPVADHRILYPFEIGGIVDMAHEIDVGGIDGDGEAVRREFGAQALGHTLTL